MGLELLTLSLGSRYSNGNGMVSIELGWRIRGLIMQMSLTAFFEPMVRPPILLDIVVDAFLNGDG